MIARLDLSLLLCLNTRKSWKGMVSQICNISAFVLLTGLLFGNASSVFAQGSTSSTTQDGKFSPPTSERPRFQRIFVPDDQVGKLVPRDYMPIAVNDLQSLLDKFETGEGVDWESQPRVSHAIYTARILGDEIFSELNYWEINYLNDVAGYLPVKPWNLSIVNPNLTNGQDLLGWGEAAQWYVDANGQMWLPIQDSTPLWFGWRGKTKETTNHTRTFSMEVPACTRSQLLLLVDESIDIQCPTAVVRAIAPEVLTEAIGNVKEPKLHESLLKWADRFATDKSILWLIEFNGGAALNLTFQAKLNDLYANRQALVSSLLQQYRMSESGIELLTRVALLNPISESQIFLETEGAVKVRDVKLGEQTLPWSPANSEASIIRVDLTAVAESSRLSQLQITSFIPTESWNSSRLPSVKVSNSVVLKGDTTLEFRPPVVPIQVTARGSEAISSSEAGTNAETSVSRWQWRWSGEPPQLDVITSSVQRTIDASSLTRLNVIKGSLNATSWVRLSPQLKTGGEARFVLGEGWILDSITPEVGSTLKTEDTVLPDGTEILLRWDTYTSNEQLTFELQAHRAIETDTLETTLPELRFLELKDGQQTGVVAVETTGRYLVKPTPSMLTMLTNEQELEAWQQSKLPRFSNSWLLHAEGGKLPALSFTSEPSTFTGKWDVFVKPGASGIEEEYRLQFRPLFGSMDRVLIRLRNSGPEELVWQWDDAGKPYLLQTVREVNESGNESYLIILPRPVNEPFVLTAKRKVTTQQWVSVSVPTSDQATSEELVLHISKLLNSRLPEAGWISVIDTEVDGSSDYAIYRAESSLADAVAVSPQDRNAIKKVWATSGSHQIRCFADGTILHHMIWKMANSRGENIRLSIPSSSKLLEIRYDGAIIPYVLDEKTTGEVTISLPATKDDGRLEVSYAEQSSPLYYSNSIPIRRATINCGVVEFHETLLTPSLYTLLRVDDFETLYGPNPLHQVGALLQNVLFWNNQQDSVFAATYESTVESENEDALTSLDRIVRWKRFELSKSLPTSAEDLSVTIWDTRFLRSAILMFGLFLGALASWGWIRAPKVMCGLALLLIASATMFTGIYPLLSIYGLVVFATAWLLGLTRISSRAVSAKTQYSVSVRSHNTVTKKALPLILISFLLGPQSQLLAAEELEDGTYGILIPYTSDGEVKGNYVYVPIEAYQFLTNPSGKSYAPRTPYMIRQATYQFRATDNMSAMDSTNFQLIADYEIEVIDASVPVRWPVGAGRAILERLIVNQFEIIPGFTVRQDDLAILWYPERSGLFKIRLQLKPISASTDLDQFDLSIPPVPTGTATVLAPSNKRVKVNGTFLDAVNGIPGTFFIGEQNRLSISVLDRDTAVDDPEPLDSEIDAWLHFQGDTTFLLTQIRMRYGDGVIPKKLTLQMGDAWKPVGLNWGDGKWDGMSTTTGNGVEQYSVNVQSNSMTEAVIYTVWKPTSSWFNDSIAPPLFPESTLINPIQFSITTSSSPDSEWKLAIPDTWTKESEERTFARWENRGLGVSSEAFTSNSRSNLPTIQPREARSELDITEACDTIARGDEFDLQYDASWSSNENGTELLLLAVPNGIRVESLTVNGTPRSDFRLVKSARGNLLSLTHIYSSTQESNTISCKASLPLELGQSTSVPRITAAFGKVSSSFFRLHRETNLVMRLEDVEQLPDTRQMLDRSSEDMLKSNQVGVLEVDLVDHFIGLPNLPSRITVLEPSSSIDGSTLGLLVANNDRWRYTLITKLRTQNAPLDAIVLELPAAVTAQMDIVPPCPFRIDPSPDGSHQLLSLFPVTPITDEQVHTISFDLNRVSGQVSLPQVTLIGSGTLRHRVGLPQDSGQHNYTWRTTGLRPEPIPADFETLLNSLENAKDTSFQFLEPTSRRYQADLQSDKSNSPKMSVKLVRHSIDINANSNALIRSTYWIDPEGFLTAQFKIPESITLLGAIENGSPQPIQRDPVTDIHSVAIQPSNLPTKLELILKSNEVASLKNLDLSLPVGMNLEIGRSMVQFNTKPQGVDSLERSVFKLDSELAAPVEKTEIANILLTNVVNLLNDAEATVANYKATDLSTWKRSWAVELRDYLPLAGQNETATKWLDQLGETLASEESTREFVQDSTTLDSAAVSLVKPGSVMSVEVQHETPPMQIHLSMILGTSLLLIGMLWLSISGTKIHRAFDRLAQTPSIPLGVAGVMMLLLPGYSMLAFALFGLAAASLIAQLYKHLLFRKVSPPSPTASKRKITA